MPVIEVNVWDGVGDSAQPVEQPKSRPEWLRWRHWRKYAAAGMAGVITALGVDARVDAAAVQEARAAAKARQAEAAARRMNAWIGDRLFGTKKAPATGYMLGGIVEIVENGEVTRRIDNPLAVTAVDSATLRGDTPDMWVLAQEVDKIGMPKFRPVEFQLVWLGDGNVQARLLGSQTEVNLNPCIDYGYADPITAICAADKTTGQEYTPHIFPGLAQHPELEKTRLVQ